MVLYILKMLINLFIFNGHECQEIAGCVYGVVLTEYILKKKKVSQTKLTASVQKKKKEN